MIPLESLKDILNRKTPTCQDRSGEFPDCPYEPVESECPVTDNYRDCPHAEENGICPDCLAGGRLNPLYEIPSREGIFFCRECDFEAENYSRKKNDEEILALLPDLIADFAGVVERRNSLLAENEALKKENASLKSEISGLEYALKYRRAM